MVLALAIVRLTSAQQQRGQPPPQDVPQALAHPDRGHVEGAHGVARHGVGAQLHHHGLRVEMRVHFLHHAAKTWDMATQK